MGTKTGSRVENAQTNTLTTDAIRVPLVKADKALLSLRASGHDFCSSIGEVGDNSFEAGANVVQIRTFTTKKKIGKNKTKTEVIERVAIGDDGCGMDAATLHQSLQLGFSTRYNSRKGLGRFGVGATIGAISQVKRVEVYSRTENEDEWLKTYIDLDEIEGGQAEIQPPTTSKLPKDCADLVGVGSGTLVVWSKADYLQQRETGGARKANTLESELKIYLARTFRKFLDGGKEVYLNDTRIRPHDPLYLMNSTRFHEPSQKSSVKLEFFPTKIELPGSCKNSLSYNPKSRQLTFHGAMSEKDRNALSAVAESDSFRESVAKEMKSESNTTEVDAIVEGFSDAVQNLYEKSNPDPTATILHTNSFEFDVPNKPGETSTVEVTVTLLPERFWERDKHSDRPGGSPHAKERYIDKNEGVSILRAGREIFYGTLREVQPPVKELDRFIGVEIRFRPELDECFQVRNIKKGAEPVNGLRDKLKNEIHKTVLTGRNHIRHKYADLKAKESKDNGHHKPAEEIINKTKEVSPQPRAGKNISEKERNQKIEAAAEAVTRDEPHKKKEVARRMRNQPVSIVPQAWPGNDFIQVEHLGTNAIVRLNTQHAFYTNVYSKLVDVIEGRSEEDAAKVAELVQVGIDLLISSYAQAESNEHEAEQKYANLRTLWGLHLKNNVQELGSA